MEWLTQTIYALTPLGLGVIILAAMALGWVLYGLRGYRHWFNRFHRYGTLPPKKSMRKNVGYVEYYPQLAQPVIPVVAHPPILNRSHTHRHSQSGNVETDSRFSTKDDLQIIEGVGPKTEHVLNNNGIYTWRELAITPISNLETMLENAGPAFALVNPETWPEQAHMAEQGQWKELRNYQDRLHKGKEKTTS
ncbi:hypothetical protein CL684_02965 [Candidatus Campbellbacteria bacterium]|nr:hypothetical protein [Candidatus Campbellbacteria bacterium]|tara:strand:- start:5321 stop:5896 length:576 start_codon:yes stop_codon:yes gene_type:complete